MAGYLFGESLSGGNHQDPSTRFTRRLDIGLDPLTWILGKHSFYTKAKNRMFDWTDRAADEGNRSLSSVVKPVDEAIAPYGDPLYHTGLGRGLHEWVNNKPGSTVGAIMGGEALAGLGAGAGAGAGASSGLGAGGTFSGALGESAVAPAFGSSIPSLLGTGYATPAGYSATAGVPSIAGTGTATFGSGSGGVNFDTQKFLQNFLSKQGQQTQNQGAPPTYRSQLLSDYPQYAQTPGDFNPMANKGLDSGTLQMLIQALKASNG